MYSEQLKDGAITRFFYRGRFS